MRTASSSCARRKRSKRCFVTVQMLSPILWSSRSGAVSSISRGIWDIAFPTSTAPSALPPPARSPSCAARGSKSAIRSTPCIAARRSGGSPRSCGSSSATGSAGSSSSITICSTSPARSPPTSRLRSTVREIGKALDLPPGEIEQVAKLADRRSGGLADELDQLPGFAGRRSAPLWKELCELAEEIAGLPRHISQHVGGMVISSRPLVEIVPLERAAMEDRVVCQWDKDSCDDARFIKIDFLALGMLSLVEECVERIAVREGTPPDLSRIDFEDPAVYDRICRGDTVGLFQIESRAQIQMIRRTRPKNLEDLAVEVAIVRPGPIVGGAVNPYVRRREDQRRVRAAGRAYEPPLEHPLLKESLAETLGVILYQDQVLQVCQALAGFTAGQAEALRRAMSRRRSRELMAGFWEEFRDGAAARGVPEQTAERVFTRSE